jgi:hypothetical protein
LLFLEFKKFQQGVIPLSIQIAEVSPTCIRCICHILSGQVVGKPRVNSAELNISCRYTLLDFWHILNQPQYFEETKIGRDWQSCDHFKVSVSPLEILAYFMSPRITPDDGIMNRYSILSPADDRLPLVADSEAKDIGNMKIGVLFNPYSG